MEPLYKGHWDLENCPQAVLYSEVIQWNLSIKDIGILKTVLRLSFIQR